MTKKAAWELIRAPVPDEGTCFGTAYVPEALKVQFRARAKEYEYVFLLPKLTANANSWDFPFPKALSIPLGPALALFWFLSRVFFQHQKILEIE